MTSSTPPLVPLARYQMLKTFPDFPSHRTRNDPKRLSEKGGSKPTRGAQHEYHKHTGEGPNHFIFPILFQHDTHQAHDTHRTSITVFADFSQSERSRWGRGGEGRSKSAASENHIPLPSPRLGNGSGRGILRLYFTNAGAAFLTLSPSIPNFYFIFTSLLTKV